MTNIQGQTPRVSIGLPAFKAKFFREALSCWKAQTFTDFEVLVYDDASPEDLRTPFEEVCGEDARFSFVRAEVNSSPRFVKNWNRALAAARGEFFVLASDDDLYAPEFLEKMVNLAEQYPACNLFHCRLAYFEKDPESLVSFSAKNPVVESQVEYLYALLCQRRSAVAPNYFMRREALCAMGGFVDLPAAWASDWLTWGHLARNGVVWEPEVLVKWRMSGINISTVNERSWAWQKYLAGVEALPLWNALIESLVPISAPEHWQKAELKRWMQSAYTWQQITSYVHSLSWGFFLKYYWQEYRRGHTTLLHCLRVAFDRLRKESREFLSGRTRND